ncbi:MAG: PcfJ domain-containing protein [Bacteroidota bacterium]
MGKKIKTEREKQLQQQQEREEIIHKLLRFSKVRFKRFEEVITRLFIGENLTAYFTDKRIWKIYDCFSMLSSKAKAGERKALKDLLIYLDKQSILVATEESIQVVWNIVQYRAYWRNDPFKWTPASRNSAHQVKELASWIFCKYPIPDFLYKSLYETVNTQHINWLIHLGGGGRVKDMCHVPIPFTQKMAHYFTQAPPALNVAEALRWAQVKGMNGDDTLAGKIAHSWIGTKPYSQEDFWESFIHLVVNGGMFNPDRLTELVDYVREEKRINPRYVLKGRTLASLMRQSDRWHNRFGHFETNQTWNSCGIEGFQVERKAETLVLHELTESRWLSQEGRAMKHCVGSYAFYCAKGKTAIYSLRRYSGGMLLDILATIEVNVALHRIVQAKAKMNRVISDEAKRIMDQWASKQGLAVSPML